MLSKILVGSCFHPPSGSAVGNFVEVDLDNFIFTITSFDLNGQDKFLNFSGNSSFRGKKGVFHPLLSQSRSTRQFVINQNLFKTAQDSSVIKPLVFVEVFIFDRDSSV